MISLRRVWVYPTLTVLFLLSSFVCLGPLSDPATQTEPERPRVDVQLISQTDSSREDFLQRHRLVDARDALLKRLTKEHFLKHYTESQQEWILSHAEDLAWEYVVHGITAEDTRDSLFAELLFGPAEDSRMLDSDLVIDGTVLGKEESLLPMDGYRSHLKIRVDKAHKGRPPGDVIYVRQWSGLSPNAIRLSSDLQAEPGNQFRFYLSRALYVWAVLNPSDLSSPVSEALQDQLREAVDPIYIGRPTDTLFVQRYSATSLGVAKPSS